jgi:hypothetical protein
VVLRSVSVAIDGGWPTSGLLMERAYERKPYYTNHG